MVSYLDLYVGIGCELEDFLLSRAIFAKDMTTSSICIAQGYVNVIVFYLYTLYKYPLLFLVKCVIFMFLILI